MTMFTDKEEKKIEDKFDKNVNMTLSEARRWKETEASKEASLSREPIEDGIKLLEQKQDGVWRDIDDGFNEFEEAKQLNNFVSRMKGAEDGDDVNQEIGMSKRDISLANWLYVPDNERKDFNRLIK